MFTAGFAEMDEAGEAAQHRMVAAARTHGMRILGPNCLGVFDARTAYYATFSSSFDSGWPVPGRIGIASQSGAYGTHLYTLARNRGIGASLCIMTGNEADVTVGECIGWLAESPEVDVIAVYAEGIREAPGLIAAFEAARAAKKPIVMQKVGRSELGTQGGEVAHRVDRRRRRGDRGGDGRVRRGARAQLRGDAGHRAHRDAAHLSGAQHAGRDHRVRRRRRADERRRRAVGLPMPEMPAATQKMLRDLVPFCAPRNPVDATAQVGNDVALIETFTEAMVQAMAATRRCWASSA